ncbi:MAG: uroporphyrinogen decarboxylase [bacterium]
MYEKDGSPLNSRKRFLSACNGQSTNPTPIWFMRQAGRIFSEYREIREEHSFLEVCQNPELNSRVTCMPVEKLDVDAAILFADIMLPLSTMNVEFDLVKGKGPVIEKPVRDREDIERIQVGKPEPELSFLSSVIPRVIEDLPEDKPLVGFAGAPFTLACYLVEGESSRTFFTAKKFMLTKSKLWHQLMERLAETLINYIRYQVDQGIEVFQLFDSWAGGLSTHHYKHYVMPHVKSIFNGLSDIDCPMIHFGTNTAGLLPLMDRAGGTVQGVDWTIDLGQAHRRIDSNKPLQGNLDPALLCSEFDNIREDVDHVLDEASTVPGHIFNLGHGLLPDTRMDTLKTVISYVRDRTAKSE